MDRDKRETPTFVESSVPNEIVGEKDTGSLNHEIMLVQTPAGLKKFIVSNVHTANANADNVDDDNSTDLASSVASSPRFDAERTMDDEFVQRYDDIGERDLQSANVAGTSGDDDSLLPTKGMKRKRSVDSYDASDSENEERYNEDARERLNRVDNANDKSSVLTYDDDDSENDIDEDSEENDIDDDA